MSGCSRRSIKAARNIPQLKVARHLIRTTPPHSNRTLSRLIRGTVGPSVQPSSGRVKFFIIGVELRRNGLLRCESPLRVKSCSTTTRYLRPLAAPATALLLLVTLLILEERHFDQNSALLLALLTAIAVAELLPATALGLVVVALAASEFQGVPVDTSVRRAELRCRSFGYLFRGDRLASQDQVGIPLAAVVSAGITTVNWFTDQTWINFIFGNQLYGRGTLRTLTYAFLIFGAFAALNLAAWAVGTAVNNVSRSRRAQLAAETRLRETATELALEQERNRIARELHDVLAHSLTVIVAQADGIRFIHRTEPESVEEASKVIADSARTALVETRKLIEG